MAMAAASAIIMLASCSGKDENKEAAALPESYDVFLLIGQSNMAGRGYMLKSDKNDIKKGVYLLNAKDEPEPAKSPLNKYSTIRGNLVNQQICPGDGFSRKMNDVTKRPILLVVNARGGTSLDEWAEGGEYYNEAVRRTKAAMQFGDLKGILWHQGEADCADEKRNTYLSRLSKMVSAMRRDLGSAEVPFVAGELGQWRSTSPKFNEMLHGISEAIPQSGWVSSEGCTFLIDESDPHFSRDGQLLLGERYADKILEMAY